MSKAFKMPAIGMACLIAGSAGADDWPWFRGPGHDGISHETGWTDAGRDEPVWMTNVGMGRPRPSSTALSGVSIAPTTMLRIRNATSTILLFM